MVISDYYFDLINWEDPECPIKKQCIPSIEELSNPDGYSLDPLNEKQYEKVPFLIHKYRSRAAFMCSNNCYMVCRHCTRKNTVMNEAVCTPDALPAGHVPEPDFAVRGQFPAHDVLAAVLALRGRAGDRVCVVTEHNRVSSAGVGGEIAFFLDLLPFP